MTGPLYEREMPPLPQADEPHKVPSGFWKIVATGSEEDPESVSAVAFIFDQDTRRDANVADHIVTIDEVEARSGLDFFWELPNDLQTTLESKASPWPL